ncbi:MAG: RNA methyltransferase [Cytophagaceae bacterium]
MHKLTMEELNRLEVEEFRNAEKNPVILLLDNVRSLHNVGSAFRTGDAFRVEKILLCGITGTPPNREIHKTALGATESVSWEYHASSSEAARALIKEGWKLIALEQTSGSIPLQTFKPEKNVRYCFVFGNEVSGVEEELIGLAETTLEIPQFGTKHSLNISVSIGIVLWDYFLKISH